jgi:hypothetical protein
VLVVDASQGVQAQTLSNLFLALDAGLEIMPGPQQDRPAGRGAGAPARRAGRAARCRPRGGPVGFRKEGTGVPELLEAIVRRVPPPVGDADAPLRALIFDSYYDRYQGAVPMVRVVDGRLRKPGMRITFGATDRRCTRWTRWATCAWAVSRPPSWARARSATCSPASSGSATRRSATRCSTRQPRRRAAAGLPRDQADGVQRPLPRRHGAVRGAARCAREAEAERREPFLRAGSLDGARLRLPLRLPRPAAPGDRAGAAGARVRAEPRHDRAEREVPGGHDGRRAHRGRESERAAGRGRIDRIEEPYVRARIVCPPNTSARCRSSATSGAASTRACTTSTRHVSSFTTSCRWPRSCSISTTG